MCVNFFFCCCPPGALYPDGTSNLQKMDDAVPPGGSYTYRWEVRPEFAPTDDDANCLTWVYHSHLDAPKDIAAGLIGPLLTCKKGRRILFCFCHFQRKYSFSCRSVGQQARLLKLHKLPAQRDLVEQHPDFTVSTISPEIKRL